MSVWPVWGEEDGGAAGLGGGGLGGLNEGLPVWMEGGSLFWVWSLAKEGLDEEVGGAGGLRAWWWPHCCGRDLCLISTGGVG